VIGVTVRGHAIDGGSAVIGGLALDMAHRPYASTGREARLRNS
jgi:hypothetical protein